MLILLVVFLLTILAPVSAIDNQIDDDMNLDFAYVTDDIQDQTNTINQATITEDTLSSSDVLESDPIKEGDPTDPPANFYTLNRDIEESGSRQIILTKDYCFNPDNDEDYNMGIEIPSNGFIIDGNDHTIDGNGQARIFNITGSNVIIRNLNFINAKSEGSAGAILSNYTGQIENCNFTNCSSYGGGGALVYYGDLTLKNCNFEGNSATQIDGDYWGGGAISIASNQLTAINSTFINNWVDDEYADGGAIVAACGNFTSCTFINNRIMNNHTNGGAIMLTEIEKDFISGYIDHCIFINNTAYHGGGAIWSYSYIRVSNSSFTKNSAYNGGAIYVSGDRFDDGGDLLIDCNFSDNRGVIGGAYNTQESRLNVTRCNFTNNHAQTGGAIKAATRLFYFVEQTPKGLYIEYSFFENNTAEDRSYNIYFEEGPYRTFMVTPEFLIPDTFTTLNRIINSSQGNEVVLNNDFMYDEKFDSAFASGINISKDNFIINGNGHSITGLNAGTIFSSFGDYLTLKNINFISYNSKGNDLIKFFDYGEIINCNFTNMANESKGRAASFDNEGVVRESSFNGYGTQTDGGALYFNQYGIVNTCEFINIHSDGDGGAVYFAQNGTVYRSRFANISAGHDGGAVYAHKLLLEISEFENISATNNGGAVYCENGTINNCSFINANGTCGGGIYLSNDGNFSKCQFINNHATDGGSVYINASSILNNCTFNNSVASGNGGAIFANQLFINNSRFDNGIAYCGGGIYSIEATVDNCSFNNNAADMGGSLYIKETASVINSSFIDSNASNSGGAIYGQKGSIKDSNFTGNSANEGGAIYLNDESNIENSIFESNRANNGGALFLNGPTTVNKSKFNKNNASDEAGAIYIKESSVINESQFLENFAENAGGAISTEANITLENCHFIDNSAESNPEINLKNGASYIAINLTPEYLNPNDFTRITDLIRDCPGNVLTLERDYAFNSSTDSDYINGIVIARNNFVIDGAGYSIDGNNLAKIFNITGNNVTLINLNLINARSTSNGGAVYFDKDGKIENCRFVNCSADKNKNGGAVCFNGTGTVINSQFLNNNATRDGGAIYFYNNGTIENCLFSNNSAYRDGGAVSGAKLISVNSSSFENNSSPRSGGGISASDVIIDWSNFTDNRGTNRGGGISTRNGTITNSNFIGNNGTDGGAIYFFNGGSIDTSNFTNNSGNSGGAISTYGDLDISNTTFVDNKANDGTNNIRITGNGTVRANNVTPDNIGPFKQAILSVINITDEIVYEDAVKITLNVTSYGKAINDGTVSIQISDETYSANVEDGIATIEIPDLVVGYYSGDVIFNGGIEYGTPSQHVSFKVTEETATIDLGMVINCTYGGNVSIQVIIIGSETPVNNGTIYLAVNNQTYAKNLTSASARFVIPDLDAGDYIGVLRYDGGLNYASEPINVSFNVKQASVDIDAKVNDIVFGDNLLITVGVSAYGKALSGVKVSAIINGKAYSADVVNGTAVIKVAGLNAGKYLANVSFDNGDNYNKPSKEISFNVFKQNSAITAANKAYIINYGGKYSITLKDAKGKALSNKRITFTLNGRNIGSATTNAKGIATIKLSAKMLKAAKAGKRNLLIKFAGDSNYNAIAKTVKVNIKKEKTKLVAKKKTFKRSKKIKRYVVFLKNSKKKAIKKVKLTLRVKGKTYKAKTNKKGKAVFKIKKLNKKGRFKAKIKFKGNKYYKAVSKKVRIRVK